MCKYSNASFSVPNIASKKAPKSIFAITTGIYKRAAGENFERVYFQIQKKRFQLEYSKTGKNNNQKKNN